MPAACLMPPQPLVDHRVERFPGKTGAMPAMHSFHRQRAQALKAGSIVVEVAVVGVFDKWAIVDDVATEQLWVLASHRLMPPGEWPGV